jgi:hypothetical protein
VGGLSLWASGASTVFARQGGKLAQSGAGKKELLSYRAQTAGWYYIEVRDSRAGRGRYALKLAKSA